MAQQLNSYQDFHLFLGNLSPSISESSLLETLQPFGSVQKLKLVPGSFFSQAWVTFKTRSSSEAAFLSLNQKLTENFTWQAKLEQSSPSSSSRLFISNLPKQPSIKALIKKFKLSGLCSFFLHQKEDFSEGFLEFSSFSHFEAALKQMNGFLMQGKNIRAVKFEEFLEEKDFNGVYVKGFPLWFSQLELRRMFENFIKVKSASVDELYGKVSGFVSCYSAEDVYIGVLLTNGLKCGSFQWTADTLKVGEINEKGEDGQLKKGFNDFEPGNFMNGFNFPQQRVEETPEIEKNMKKDWERLDFSLLIRNLHLSMNKKKLEEICQEYGPVVQIQMEEVENISYGDQGQIYKETICKGSAVVTFKDQFTARKALGSLRNKCIESQRLHVVMFSSSENHSTRYHPQFSYFKPFPTPYSSLPRFPIYQGGTYFKPDSFPVYPAFRPFNKNPPIFQGRLKPMVPGMPVMEGMPIMQGMPSMPIMQGISEVSSCLNQISSRQAMGQKLYPKVLQLTSKDLVGKVTGMLLELDEETLNGLVQNPLSLEEMVRNAIQVLRKAWADKPEQLVLLENH